MNTFVKALIAAVVIGGIAAAVILGGGDDDNPRPIPDTPSNVEVDTDPSPSQPNLPTVEVGSIDVIGTVENEAGDGLAGTTIRCERIEGSMSSATYSPVDTVTTGAGGGFAVTGLAPGRYRFRASLSGFSEGMQRVTLAEGTEPEPIAFVLTSGLTIRGTVRGAVGEPVPGAIVEAFKERAKENASLEERLIVLIDFQDMRTEPGVLAETDESGEYELQGLDAMKYRVRVAAAGLGPAERRYIPAGSEGVDFELQVGGQLIGRVEDVTGGAIAGASVAIYRDSGTEDLLEIIQETALPPIDVRTSDASGSFLFDNLGGDPQYRLVARAPGYQETLIEKVKVELGQQAQLTVVMAPGETIRGVVYDPYGSVLAGARCSVNPVGVQRQGRPADFEDDSIVTDANGEFVFSTLVDGDHRLVVSHDEYATFVQNKLSPSDEPLTVHLTEGCAISGVVYDQVTTQPVPGAVVTVHDLGGEQKTGVSDASGLYFVRGISETRRGIAHINVEHEAYQRVSNQKVDVSEGTVTDGQDFYLERNGSVSGVVVDAGGSPLEGVSVSARRYHSNNAVVVNVGRVATSGPDGRFSIDAVESGIDTFLEGSHGEYLTSRGEMFDIDAGQEVGGLQLVMRVGGAISGRVVDDSGQPVADATIGVKDEVMSVVNPASLSNKTDSAADGTFTLRRLAAGEQVLLAAAKGYLTTEVTGVEVVEGHTTGGLDIVMTAGAHIAGTVRNGLGEPLSGARVTVIDTSAGLRKMSTSTDTQGVYRFDELGYYPVDVEAEASGHAKIRLTEQPVNTEGVDFVLESYGGISGQVFTESGEVLRAFSVSPRMIDANGRALPRVPSRTFQGTNGEYTYPNLEPGVYEVVIGAPGYSLDTIPNVVVNSDRITDVGAATLGEGGRISGYVIDLTGAAIPGATVTVVGGTRHFLQDATTTPSTRRTRRDQVTSGPDGSFELIGLASGQVTLKVEHRSYLTEIVRDVISGTQGFEVALASAGAIEGTLQSPSGEHLVGYQILISSGGRGHDRRVVTDRKGGFSATGLESGLYVLRVTNFGRGKSDVSKIGNTPTYEVDVVAGEVSWLDIVMDRAEGDDGGEQR